MRKLSIKKDRKRAVFYVFFISWALALGVSLPYYAVYADPFAGPTVATRAATSIGETFVLLNGEANPNGTESYGWFEWGLTTALGASTIGPFERLGNGTSFVQFSYRLIGLLPGKTYYFRSMAGNNYNVWARGATLSFTTQPREVLQANNTNNNRSGSSSAPPPPPPPPPVLTQNAPSIATRPAAFIGRASALLNGTVNPNGVFTSAWFEWGKTTSLGSTTTFQPMGNGINSIDYNFLLENREPGTLYYYRAVAQNSLGISRGVILSLVTAAATNVTPPAPPPPPRSPRPASTLSPATPPSPPPAETKNNTAVITLAPTVDNNEPRRGEEFTLTTVYKNESKTSVNNAVLSVKLPENAEYVSANLAPDFQNGERIEFKIGSLGPESQGATSVRLKVKDAANKGEPLVFKIIMDYKDGDGKDKSTDVFMAVTVGNGNAFLAAIFGAFGNFWGLLLLILFLLLFLLLFILFMRRKREKENGKKSKDEFAVVPGRV